MTIVVGRGKETQSRGNILRERPSKRALRKFQRNFTGASGFDKLLFVSFLGDFSDISQRRVFLRDLLGNKERGWSFVPTSLLGEFLEAVSVFWVISPCNLV